jgi:hypothetical protein
MVDLDDLAAFAAERGHNLTGPLSHEQVVALANAWFPEVRFHEKERFHPVDLPGMLDLIPPIFDGLPEPAKDEFRISLTTGTLPDGQPIVERFDPPVVHAAAGNARVVLGSGADAAGGMDELDDLGRSGVFTYGARLEAAREFFGASNTVAGGTEPLPGDPRVPRHLPMVVRAELRMLLETLKHELQLDDLPEALKDRGRPIDGIWSGFAVEDSFFVEELSPDPFSREEQRAILADLVAAHEAGAEAEAAALENMELPSGWRFVRRAWEAVKQFAFLEYYLVYAFNDYKEYGTAPFENEHEGDIEGCCVVFERRFLERFANGTVQANEVIPHTVITSAHEEFQELDSLQRLPVTLEAAREDLRVYVAPGSHASYLTAGPHDILDFEDVVTDLPLQLPTWAIVVGTISGPGLLPMVAVIFGLAEKFVIPAEDETSDNGARIGPEPPDPASLEFEKRLEVTPLSNIQNDVNIYQDTPALRAALAVRGFPGIWGGDDELIDKSPPWENKTARYFRRFLRSANIDPAPVVD